MKTFIQNNVIFGSAILKVDFHSSPTKIYHIVYNPITGYTEEVEDEEEYDPYFPNSQQGILGGKDYHTCKWIPYVGFTEFYDFCEYCQQKRKFTGKLPE